MDLDWRGWTPLVQTPALYPEEAYLNPAIPRYSRVLVTMPHTYLGAHVVRQLLRAGYHVRGVVQEAFPDVHYRWLKSFREEFCTLQSSLRGIGSFEVVEIKDFMAKGAFIEVIKGVSGVIHTGFPDTINDRELGTEYHLQVNIALLEACNAEASVRRVVITCLHYQAWRQAAFEDEIRTAEGKLAKRKVPRQWEVPPRDGLTPKFDRRWRGIADTQEQTWQWMWNDKRTFTLNMVFPGVNLGNPVSIEHQQNPEDSIWVKRMWQLQAFDDDGQTMSPGIFVHVEDNALLHYAALVHGKVESERLFAFNHTFNANDILWYLKSAYWRKYEFPKIIPNLKHDSSVLWPERSEELIKMFGRPQGWIGLGATIQSMAQVGKKNKWLGKKRAHSMWVKVLLRNMVNKQCPTVLNRVTDGRVTKCYR